MIIKSLSFYTTEVYLDRVKIGRHINSNSGKWGSYVSDRLETITETFTRTLK